MTATKFKTGIILAVWAMSFVLPLLVQHEAEARLRNQDELLEEQTEEMTRLRSKNAHLLKPAPSEFNEPLLSKKQNGELLKLRGEAGRLRKEAQELAEIDAFRERLAQLPLNQIWPERARHLKEWLKTHPSENVPEAQFLPDRSWLNSIYPIPVETDEECRRAMSLVRVNAEGPTITPGKRTFLFTTPKVQPRDGGANRILIESIVLEVPEQLLAQNGMDQFKIAGHDSSLQTILSAADYVEMMKQLEATEGVSVLSRPAELKGECPLVIKTPTEPLPTITSV